MSSDGRRRRVQGGWAQPFVACPQPQSSKYHDDLNSDASKLVGNSRKPSPAWSDMQTDSSLDQRNASGIAFQDQAAATKMRAVMPQYFSWVLKDKVCAMAFPGQAENLQYLLDNNVGCLISLTPERIPPVSNFPELNSTLIKIKDFAAPTIEQVCLCLDIMEKTINGGKAVAVHCMKGRGRTGTMLACYFVKFHNMDAQQAILNVKGLRFGFSCQTREQHNAVVMFERQLNTLHDSHN